MSLMVRPSTVTAYGARRSLLRAPLGPLTKALAALATVVALAAPAPALAAPIIAVAAPSAAVTPAVTVAVPATPAAAGTATPAATPAAVTVDSLAMTGTITTVTVHRIYRRGQVQWINHVLNTRLVDLDGCQARRTKATWSGRTYRSTVRTVCAAGAAPAQEAARKLVADRPWYRVKVSQVPLTGFGLLADLPEGNDRAMPAALAALPSGPFTFAEGDDLSLNYVGEGVSQARLDAAVAAFARALGITPDKVEVTPLAAG